MARQLIGRHRQTLEPLEPRRLLATVPIGGEFRINTTTAGNQTEASVASDANGNFVVAWQSADQDGSGLGIYAQRFDASGAPQGTEFRANTFTTNDQAAPSVAMDSDGDFIIAWLSRNQDTPYGVYAQRYDAAGTPQGLEFRINKASTSGGPSVAMDADGDFVVAWHSVDGGGPNQDVFARRYNASGVAQGGEFPVNDFTFSLQGVGGSRAVAMDEQGNFVITWISIQEGSGAGIYAKRYNAAGLPLTGEFQVNTYTTGEQRGCAVAMNVDGSFVIAWRSDGQDGSSNGVYAQRYDALAVPQGGEFRVNTATLGSQWRPSPAIDHAGNIVIAWEASQGDGHMAGVFAQQYDGSGAAAGDESQVNTHFARNQLAPSSVMTPNGGFIIVWHSELQDGSGFGIYGQRYAPPDQVPPVVQSSMLEFDARQAVSITFDEPLDPASVSAGDLAALNLDDNSTPVANSVILSAGNTVATWVFNSASSFIGDGDYRFTLASGAVSDVSGNAFASTHEISGADIYFLAGDANRDRTVNLADFNILAGNFGTTGKLFSQGNFDYDANGNVSLADFNLLAGTFGTGLARRGRLVEATLAAARHPESASDDDSIASLLA